MVPRRSIYVMRGASRYLMTHAILSNHEVSQLYEKLSNPVYAAIRSRRISVICRTRATDNLIDLTKPETVKSP
ncbi:unnamed protein product [Echinostoma caproni]|uniref:RNA-directed DNA polymerase n=1 Tax=Echinostoma caproni TaxID=27848 RepID=A0A183B6J3_9TREM|nr:unnamed protein product [Echinostoma caproni]